MRASVSACARECILPILHDLKVGYLYPYNVPVTCQDVLYFAVAVSVSVGCFR